MTTKDQPPAAGEAAPLCLPVSMRASHFDSCGIHHVAIVDSRGVVLFSAPKEYATHFVTACNSHSANLAKIARLRLAAQNAANVLAALATGQLSGIEPDSNALSELRAALESTRD